MGKVIREVTDLPEDTQQESGRVGFRLCPPDSADMEDGAWSRMPLLTNILQLTPLGLPGARQRIPEPMLPVR